MKKHTFGFQKHKNVFLTGMKDGLPIGLGYFAVSFSLGIAAGKIGLHALQGLLVSLLCNASAGEYIGFTVIAAGASYWEMAIATFVANARYLLMSCAMSQRAAPNLSIAHRLLMSFHITDELFGISIAREGDLNPYYHYGAVATAAPLWAVGTMLGVMAGNLLPLRIVSAFSVALYGMFLAIVIPVAKNSKIIGAIILICFASSYLASILPWISTLSEGTRIIILTVVISAGAALLFPKEEATNREKSK